MGACTQEETDAIVDRCRKVVKAYGDGQDPRLADVRKWYSIFEKRKEHMAMVTLDDELDKAFAAIAGKRADGNGERFAEFDGDNNFICPDCGRVGSSKWVDYQSTFRCERCDKTYRIDPDVIRTMEEARN